MINAKFDTMNLDKLRRYVLTHRDDMNAFHLYIDRSKASDRMIAINLDDSHGKIRWNKRFNKQPLGRQDQISEFNEFYDGQHA
jgi:hypothetical protein